MGKFDGLEPGAKTLLAAALLSDRCSDIGNAPSWRNAYEIRRHPASLRYSLVAAYCWLRALEITDDVNELLNQISGASNALSGILNQVSRRPNGAG
jgi:hypothetical protein